MSEHAEFSPSKSHRFLRCTASHELESRIPDTYSDAAREGSRAHALAEYCLTKRINPQNCLGLYIHETDTGDGHTVYSITDLCDGYVITQELVDAVTIYYRYVTDKASTYETESRIDIIDDKCFGTADCIFVRGTTLYVVDFKYGVGVTVSAEKNTQLLCYALGALRYFPGVRRAKLVIVQPRIACGKISEYIAGLDEVRAFGTELENKIAEIQAGKARYEIGSHCKFCKGVGICPEKHRKYLADFNSKNNLEISYVLNIADEIREWLNQVEQSAIAMLRAGEKISGFALGSRTPRTKIADEKRAIAELTELGYTVTEPSILSIGRLKKIVPNDLLSKYTVKESSGVKLVRESDLSSDF